MNGTQLLSPPVNLGAVPSAWSVIGTGDFNGDGMSDILWRNTTTDTVGIWLMNGTTWLSPRCPNWVLAPRWQVAGTGDFDGDGMTDIVSQNSNANLRSGSWTVTNAVTTGITVLCRPAWSVTGTGDFNGDGIADLLWFNTSTNAVGIWLMSGTQWLSQPVTLVPVPAGWLIFRNRRFQRRRHERHSLV